MTQFTTIPEAITDLLASESKQLNKISFVQNHIETDPSMHKEARGGRLTEMSAVLGSFSTKQGDKGLILMVLDMRTTVELKTIDEITDFEALTSIEPLPLRMRTTFHPGDLVAHPILGTCEFIEDHQNGLATVRLMGTTGYQPAEIKTLKFHPDFNQGQEVIGK